MQEYSQQRLLEMLPSGSAAIAALPGMLEQGLIDKDETVVVPITGSGFKDTSIFLPYHPITEAIPPFISELEKLLS